MSQKLLPALFTAPTIAAAIVAAFFTLPTSVFAHDVGASSEFNRAGCTFTTVGNNLYLPILPGLSLKLEGEEDGAEIESTTTVTDETILIDGVLTRVVEELEIEDGEIHEFTKNYVAICRETNDVWYFGEDVDNYEDGQVINHNGSFRAGVDNARPGILMPGSPLNGAHYFQEQAPGVAEDAAEVAGIEASKTVPAGTFQNVLKIVDNEDEVKYYAPGLGQIVDEILELTEIVEPHCRPNATTHCLSDGRFKVTATWKDFQGQQGNGRAILSSAETGEFWFFSADNTELVVKVLNACDYPGSDHFWVFVAGLTNVEVKVSVQDTLSVGAPKVYSNSLGSPFQPVLDTAAFATCP